MPPPVRHGGEPSIWQKSKCVSHFSKPTWRLTTTCPSVLPAPSEVCPISQSDTNSFKPFSWLEWALSWEGELGSLLASSLAAIVSCGTHPTPPLSPILVSFIRAHVSIKRGGAGPRGFLATLSQYMLSSAATFSFFLAIGSVRLRFLHPSPFLLNVTLHFTSPSLEWQFPNVYG